MLQHVWWVYGLCKSRLKLCPMIRRCKRSPRKAGTPQEGTQSSRSTELVSPIHRELDALSGIPLTPHFSEFTTRCTPMDFVYGNTPRYGRIPSSKAIELPALRPVDDQPLYWKFECPVTGIVVRARGRHIRRSYVQPWVRHYFSAMASDKPLVLVIGANGRTGASIVDGLLASGNFVRAVLPASSLHFH